MNPRGDPRSYALAAYDRSMDVPSYAFAGETSEGALNLVLRCFRWNKALGQLRQEEWRLLRTLPALSGYGAAGLALGPVGEAMARHAPAWGFPLHSFNGAGFAPSRSVWHLIG